jgi:hypothetical protein
MNQGMNIEPEDDVPVPDDQVIDFLHDFLIGLETKPE